jgi:hypothetical protein
MLLFVFLALGVAASLLGCGAKREAPPALTPVMGKVSVDGEPITSGMVIFHPEDGAPAAPSMLPTGMIQRDGSYTLVSGASPGAAAGKYKVIITAVGPGKGRVPGKYTDPKTSDLVVEVVENTSDYDLRLRR